MQTIGPDTGGPVPDARGPAFPQLRRLALRDAFRQVARGRQFTREALEDWGWDGQEAAEDAVLVVSELVTNAKLHAGGCHELMLRAGNAFRVEVYDGYGELPRPLPALRPGRPGRPGGHGLRLVHLLADRWGVQAIGHGKVVWAEFDAERLRTGRRGHG
ncbi:ATP-binding protein [Streptomyces sp. NPDC058682]|uniref:ATP-binding protein n=1 Tax=unclassified Streptomyces TaxID=2593676 RepID=UPI00224E2F73|nr:ATP-binding protein [Streptomyces sp. NBC_01214]MCX4804096.1 ATP-binding protein [Streptomyces sp. NBC_01214]